MESNQEAANAANIKTAKLTKWLLGLTVILVVIGLVTLVLMAWPLLYPAQASQPPLTGLGGERIVKGWTPIIVLASAIVLSAVSLLIVTVRGWKNKSLRERVSDLEADLQLERKNASTLKRECKKAQGDLLGAENRHKVAISEANRQTDFYRVGKEEILTELKKREADLAELKTLSDMRFTQAENIPSHIVVNRVNAGDLMLVGNTQTGPCVTLELRIRNESLFNISIKPEDVKGNLVFADSPLPEPISQLTTDGREPISNLKPLEWGSLTLYQPLRVADVEWIKSLQDSQKGCFRLTNLYIPITVDSQYKVAGNLKIPTALETVPVNTFRVTQSS